ncbi:MAG: CpsD/CapB family tyrosine-protein kinase [Acidobacteria bacterium]|nr:CpsD/CapB family tyrosine-protein kinase [Acidobacteriota bacterium]MBI3427842.1 CpsD/CapB family tyrosine-protein kinase [Acidobacteriota bacterium]
MARVFDALRREQKRKKRVGEHDPLARAILSEPESEQEAEVGGFDLDAPIGTPAGPRSNEGMLLPGIGRAQVETAPLSQTATITTPAAAAPVNTSTPVTAPVTPTVTAANTAAPPVEPAGTRISSQAFQPPQTKEPPRVSPAQVRPAQVHPRLMMLHEPHATGCEQYRTLRTELFHAAERELTQIIVVTSSIAGEGKTATTLNLALAIAQSPNRRVLVIDGDLRHPSVAPYLDLKPFAGFAEVLQDKADLFDAISRLSEHDLYLLPVKRETKTPTELLSSPRFQAALGELRQYFDFILIDSPPVKPFADARLLANHADATLFIVRAGFAAYETVEEAVHALADFRVLGVVLNGATDVPELGNYEDYQVQTGRSEPTNLLWSTFGPRVRESWLGRRLKL